MKYALLSLCFSLISLAISIVYKHNRKNMISENIHNKYYIQEYEKTKNNILDENKNIKNDLDEIALKKIFLSYINKENEFYNNALVLESKSRRNKIFSYFLNTVDPITILNESVFDYMTSQENIKDIENAIRIINAINIEEDLIEKNINENDKIILIEKYRETFAKLLLRMHLLKKSKNSLNELENKVIRKILDRKTT